MSGGPAVASPAVVEVRRTPLPPPLTLEKPGRRLSGDDLLAALFEAFGDLQFLRDSFAGAEFVLTLMLEKLPSHVGLVSLFDINKRDFVVVRQMGGAQSALCLRQPERAPIASAAMRMKRAVVVTEGIGIERATDDRWRTIRRRAPEPDLRSRRARRALPWPDRAGEPARRHPVHRQRRQRADLRRAAVRRVRGPPAASPSIPSSSSRRRSPPRPTSRFLETEPLSREGAGPEGR